jgi:hypothetical protein
MARTPTLPRPTTEATPRPGASGLERLAWLMDRAFVIPGTNVRVGLDAILGLLPVGGDVATGLVQAGLVLYALAKYRVPKAVAARMAANVVLDVAIGAIPLVGDVFDVFFKANTRNVCLLEEVRAHHDRGEPVPSAPSVRYLLLIGGLLGAAITLVLIGFIALLVWATRARH